MSEKLEIPVNRALITQIYVTVNGAVATISLSSRFDLYTHCKFHRSGKEALEAEGVTQIECDMNNVEYLDSSALGMLLQLREKANNAHRDLLLSNCRSIVLRVLEVANFNKLFTIQGTPGNSKF